MDQARETHRRGRPGRAGARPLAALVRDRRGATAVEFAMLAFPFFALFCVIVQSGVQLLAQQTLDMSVERAARLLRTGEFQDAADGSDPATRMRKVLCGSALVFFRCGDLKLDVTRAGSFSQNQVVPAYDVKKKDWASGFGSHFDCPAGDDVVSLRVAVPVLGPFSLLDFGAQPMGGGQQLLTATAIFRSEPYTGKTCS